MKKRWDIFCKVVDNFGDIGVCWRLAKQLSQTHGIQVRLFVDDLKVASKIIPIIDFNKISQPIDNIIICDFNSALLPVDVVIEAFACGLPESYQTQMSESTVWVNLEYLSAEPWVEEFHAKHSERGHLKRHFYFPGFSEKTGGLLREPNLMAHRAEITHRQIEELKISLFCYDNAPLEELFDAVSDGFKKVIIYAPLTNSVQNFAPLFGKTSFIVGDVLTKNKLKLHVLPFLSQDEYDSLLRSCDLNFVRGEDSWVRAIWAGKPFVWQPYVQDDDAHFIKLHAFLDLFFSDHETACKAHECWSSGRWPKSLWLAYQDHLSVIHTHVMRESEKLSIQSDLACKLVIFCNKF
jgi:uncharacterized repeat protein (TIGR03837 family)